MLPNRSPLPAPVDPPGVRRIDRIESPRAARSRTSLGPRQGPVRRIQSSGPVGPLVERNRMLIPGMGTSVVVRQGVGRSMTTTRKVEGESLMARELEELRARTEQMEKTLRYS